MKLLELKTSFLGKFGAHDHLTHSALRGLSLTKTDTIYETRKTKRDRETYRDRERKKERGSIPPLD